MLGIFLGAPGVGKGTQAKILSKRLEIPAISTGDILRLAVREGTPLGLKAKAKMEAGELVSDDIVIGLVEEKLASGDCAVGAILDGFPRTVNQADELGKILEKKNIKIDFVINIDLDDDIIVNRIVLRRVCPLCNAVYHLEHKKPRRDNLCDNDGSELIQRADDSEDVVRERLRVYREESAPLIEYYKNLNGYHDLDGVGSVDDIADKIHSFIEKIQQ